MKKQVTRGKKLQQPLQKDGEKGESVGSIRARSKEQTRGRGDHRDGGNKLGGGDANHAKKEKRRRARSKVRRRGPRQAPKRGSLSTGREIKKGTGQKK